MAFSYGQSIQITDMTATPAPGGINVNLKTVSFNGAGYLSYEYTITANVINLSVCYWFNVTLPVLTFENNFFIPVAEPDAYSLYVTVYNSSSAENCDYYSTGGTVNTTILTTPRLPHQDGDFALYPNPTTGIAEMASDVSGVDALQVYDVTGKLVFQNAGNVRSVDLSNLSNGVYLVKTTVGNRSFVQHIVKK